MSSIDSTNYSNSQIDNIQPVIQTISQTISNTTFDSINSNQIRVNGVDVALVSGNQTILNKMLHSQSGTVTDPSYSFAGDNDTGFYRVSAGIIGSSCDGLQVLTLSSTEHTTNGIPLRLPGGTSGSVSSLRFAGFNNTYGIGGDSNGVFINNASIRVCRFSVSGLIIDNDAALRLEAPRYRVTTGASNTASSPAYSFQDETNSGMYRFAASDIRLSVGGSDKISFGSSTNSSLQVLHIPNGSASNPSLAFQSEQNTGIYRVAANDMGFTVGGSVRFRLSTGNITTSLIYLTTNAGSVSNPSIQVGSSSYGLYQTGTNLSVAVSNTQVASWETGGMKLYNSVANYVPSNLNYYEEIAQQSGTWNWGNISVSGNYICTRIGRIVHFEVQSEMNFTTPSSGQSQIVLSSGTAIPSRFRPSQATVNSCGTCLVTDGATSSLQLWYVSVGNDGRVYLNRLPQGSVTNTAYTYKFSASWIV